MRKDIKKYGFAALMLCANLLLLSYSPTTGAAALAFTTKNFIGFLYILTPIFICVGLMDVWIERETMISMMGRGSGFRGSLAALLLGMVTAVPIYALLPVAGILLKKGCRISNAMLFLCASSSIRIPLLLFEISSLGWAFTLLRFGLNLAVVGIIAFLIEAVLSPEEKEAIYLRAEKGG